MLKGIIHTGITLGIALTAWISPLAAEESCGTLTYTCQGSNLLPSFSDSVEMTAEDASDWGLDRACFGVSYYRSAPGTELRGLVMLVAGDKRAEQGLDRVCFAWAFGREPKGELTGSSTSAESCYIVKEGTAFQISSSNARSALNCTIKFELH